MSMIGDELKRMGLYSVFKILEKDPEKNLPRILGWLDRFMPSDVLPEQRELFKQILDNKESHWYKLIMSVWNDIDTSMIKTLFENIVINANALTAHKLEESREKYGCNIPWVLAIELGEGENDLDFDDWDDVIEQAKELGTFAFIFQGGEPLEYKEEIIALCNKHSECEFMIFDDCTRFDEEFAQEVLRVKNLITTLKINKPEDFDRGLNAIEIMRTNKLPFAVSILYDEENQEVLGSEEFTDKLVANGVKFGIYLSSVPDEKDSLYPKLKEYRESKPIFTLDFCKDKGMLGGCMAGGRYYCHINAQGGVEPCFFMSISDSNVKNGHLVDAYKSPLFKEFEREQDECRAIEYKATLK